MQATAVLIPPREARQQTSYKYKHSPAGKPIRRGPPRGVPPELTEGQFLKKTAPTRGGRRKAPQRTSPVFIFLRSKEKEGGGAGIIFTTRPAQKQREEGAGCKNVLLLTLHSQVQDCHPRAKKNQAHPIAPGAAAKRRRRGGHCAKKVRGAQPRQKTLILKSPLSIKSI